MWSQISSQGSRNQVNRKAKWKPNPKSEGIRICENNGQCQIDNSKRKNQGIILIGLAVRKIKNELGCTYGNMSEKNRSANSRWQIKAEIWQSPQSEKRRFELSKGKRMFLL